MFSLGVLLLIFWFLIVLNCGIFLAVVVIKLWKLFWNRRRLQYSRRLKPVLDKLFSESLTYFTNTFITSMMVLDGMTTSPASKSTLESLLLDSIESGDADVQLKARNIASYFDFPEKALIAISTGQTNTIAGNARRAGLYQYADAIPGMLVALRIPSSDIQYQVLMALSRIGNREAFVKAFDLIHQTIFINQKAFVQILDQYKGDIECLTQAMMQYPSPSLAAVFENYSQRGSYRQ